MPQSLDKKITTKVTYVHEQFEPFSLFCNQSWMTKIPSDYMAVNDLKQLMPVNINNKLASRKLCDTYKE